MTREQSLPLSVSLHQLRLFVTLARHRSFTRAGDEFGITQSAVSRSIRELEDEIALRLSTGTSGHITEEMPVQPTTLEFSGAMNKNLGELWNGFSER